MQLQFLFDAIFQSNPEYELVESGNLSQSEQQALAGFSPGSPEIFGVFRPLSSGTSHTVKLAYKDVALLFYFLQVPGKLPGYILKVYDDEMNSILAKLVMEEVLQIAHNGNFVCGPRSLNRLYKNIQAGSSASKHIPNISRSAIEYVLKLHHVDCQSAIARLYCYNTVPAISNLYGLDNVEKIENFLGISCGLFQQQLDHYWDKHLPAVNYSWLSFSRKGDAYKRTKKDVTFKIYVSPPIQQLPVVFQKTVTVLQFTKAFAFKTGVSEQGFLRPDKFVIYFSQFKDLQAAAVLLKDELKEYSAQGVPFTAQLDDSGLLSWGIDPPQEEGNVYGQAQSWRSGIAQKLASAVMRAKEAALDKNEAYDYVINQIYLDKINPFTWEPMDKKFN